MKFRSFSTLNENTKFQCILRQLAVYILLENSTQYIPQASKSRPNPILCPPWLRFLVSINEDRVTLIPSRRRWVYAIPTWLLLFTLVCYVKIKARMSWHEKLEVETLDMCPLLATGRAQPVVLLTDLGTWSWLQQYYFFTVSSSLFCFLTLQVNRESKPSYSG